MEKFLDHYEALRDRLGSPLLPVAASMALTLSLSGHCSPDADILLINKHLVATEQEDTTTTFPGQSHCFRTIEEFDPSIRDEVIEVEGGYCYASDAPYEYSSVPEPVIPANPLPSEAHYTG